MSNRIRLVRSRVRSSLIPRPLDTDLTYRVKAKLGNGEMIIPGDQWPVFLYAGYNYDQDDPWKGLLRGSILVSVRYLLL